MSDKTKYIITGIVLVFFVKYIILGLDAWNEILHPHRFAVDHNSQANYTKPFLGLFSK